MKIELALVKPEATHYGCDISGKILVIRHLGQESREIMALVASV